MDWPAVAASGARFAFCKATEGVGFVSHTLTANWQGIKAAGLVRGAYHFARPSELLPAGSVRKSLPGAQALHFLHALETAGGLQDGDLLVLDLEDGTGDLKAWALTWLREVERMTGIRPLLYSSAGFLAAHGCTGDAELGRYPLWLAAYGDTEPKPPEGWSQVSVWQRTDKASVPGIAGPVDESVVLATL